MKKLFFFLCAISVVIPALIPKIICAQNYNMTNGTTNTCTGNFYDSGGPAGNYSNNENLTKTFCSCNGGTITVSFTSFNIEALYDFLYIYNGPNTLSPPVGVYNGTTSPGTVTSSGTCLTFNFTSDGSVTPFGWTATINCTPGVTIPTVTASGPTTFCEGGSVTLTASSGTTYSWSNGAVTQAINVTASGNYAVSVTTGGCVATSNPMNVTVKPTPTVTVTGAGTICSGGSQQLTASGASSYTWSPASTLSNSAISNPVASPSATTAYSVTGTGANGCTKTSTVTVTVSPLIANAGIDQTICTGQSATLSATGGTNYSWNTGDTDASIMVTPATTTTYTVLVSDAGGCSGTDEVTVTVNPSAMADAGDDVSICNSDSTTLNGTGNGSYLWSPTTGLSDPAVSNPVATPSSTITYTLTVTNSCGSASDSVTITITTTPSVSAGIDDTVCVGDTTQLITSGSGTFIWSPSTGLSCSTCPNPFAYPNTTTTYAVTISTSCGTASDSVTVVVDSCLTIEVSSLSASSQNILIIPNPTTGKFQVFQRDSPKESNATFGAGFPKGLLRSRFQVERMEIYNVMGEQIQNLATGNMQLENNNMTFIDISSQPAGIYFLKIISQSESSISKIIKQ